MLFSLNRVNKGQTYLIDSENDCAERKVKNRYKVGENE